MRAIALALGLLFLGAPLAFGKEQDTSAADFLYRLSVEYRKAGRTDEAMHELHKTLLLNPDHQKAKHDLAVLEQAKAAEEARVMEEARRHALSEVEGREEAKTKARESAMERAIQESRPHPVVQPPAPAAPPEAAPGAVEPPPAPAKQHLADRLSLPAKMPLGVERLVSPAEGGRPEILSETKRAGFQKLYKEGIGLQPIRGLGFSARTEIYDEPNPVDDFILETKILNFEEISQFRRSILPLFTRSWAWRAVADYEPFPRLTYEYDERDVYHEFQTRYGFKDRHLRTHAVNVLYSLPRMPLVGLITVNPWYKRVLQDSDQDLGTYEHRDELIMNLSMQPSENVEYFFQYDTYQADKTRTIGGSKLQLFKGQVRLRFPQWKFFAIPSYEYSSTTFDPSDDEFSKRDFFVDWGIDLARRLRASSKEEWIYTKLSQGGQSPSNPDAQTFTTFNTLSYELFKDFDLSLGVDYSKGLGYSNFNNVGLRAEMELFKPGIVRAKLGYEWLSYYNIQDDLSLLYLRFFLFQ